MSHYDPQMIDGRITWPNVFQYQIIEGPMKGKFFPYPPTVDQCRDTSRKEGEPSTYPYKLVVWNQPIFNKLKDIGVLTWPLHLGPRNEVIDQRPAPKAG